MPPPPPGAAAADGRVSRRGWYLSLGSTTSASLGVSDVRESATVMLNFGTVKLLRFVDYCLRRILDFI